MTLNGAGQNIAINLDVSDPNNLGDLGVGYAGTAAMTIRNGTTVLSRSSFLGYGAGSSGTATVTGAGRPGTLLRSPSANPATGR